MHSNFDDYFCGIGQLTNIAVSKSNKFSVDIAEIIIALQLAKQNSNLF